MSTNNLTVSALNSLENWKFLLSWLVRKKTSCLVLEKTQDISKPVVEQNKSSTNSTSSDLNINKTTDFLKSDFNNSVGILNSEVSPRTMCIRITNPYIIERFIQVIQNEFSSYIDFNFTMKNPIIINSLSTKSLLLIYKMPSFLYNNKTLFESNTNLGFEKTCRLGLKVEYIFGKSSFANLNDIILNDPGRIYDLSFLPNILYPWNPTLDIKVNPDYDSNLNSNRIKGFTDKTNQKLIASGKGQNIGSGKGGAIIGRTPTIFNWCNIENYNLQEVRIIYILSCEDDQKCRDSIDKFTMLKRKSLEKYEKTPTDFKNQYFGWFCQYDFYGNDHSLEMHNFGIVESVKTRSAAPKVSNKESETPSLEPTISVQKSKTPKISNKKSETPSLEPTISVQKSKTSKISNKKSETPSLEPTISVQKSKTSKISNKESEIRLDDSDFTFFENQENLPTYTFSKTNNSLKKVKIYRTPENATYPDLNYSELSAKGIISNKDDVINQLNDLQFHPFRIYKAIRNYNTSLNCTLLVAFLEYNQNIFLEDDIWLGKNVENVLIWWLNKNNLLSVICIKQKDWFIKDGQVWKKVDFDQVLSSLYFGLYDLQIGEFMEALKNVNFRYALIKKVNYDTWPLKID